MKTLKKILKWFLWILSIPTAYIVISLLLTYIPVNRQPEGGTHDKTIFLGTNGVHLDIVLPLETLDSVFLAGIKREQTDKYLAFGWGDENFYLNTRTWGDLSFSNAFRAMFLKSSTLLHVTRYKKKRPGWAQVPLTEGALQKMRAYILQTFETRENGEKIILENKGYASNDDFYRSKGSYSCFKTCNTWANTAFKESGLKACLWTPFDFGLMGKYK